MPNRPLKPCAQPGCKELVVSGRCEKHAKQYQQETDRRRGSASQRGYTYSWQKYSRWYLSRPENQFCALQLPGCTGLAEVVDHIIPVPPDDPKFRDPGNHQPLCRHCNSVKGRREMRGEKNEIYRKA